MTMMESRPNLETSIKEEDDDFFIMCKNANPDSANSRKDTSASIEKEPVLNNVDSKPHTYTEAVLPSAPNNQVLNYSIPLCNAGINAQAVAAAIQAVTANSPQWNSEEAKKLAQSLPSVSPMFSMPAAFTLSLPNKAASTSSTNTDLKFIVLPVHQCWGCRQEFTDLDRFIEHVTKSLCLPSADVKNDAIEVPQLLSNASASPSDQMQEKVGTVSAATASGNKTAPHGIGKIKPEVEVVEDHPSVDAVIESVLQRIRESIANEVLDDKSKSPVQSNVKNEPMEVTNELVQPAESVNDSNNNNRLDDVFISEPDKDEIDESMMEEDVADLLNIDPEHPARLKKAVYSCYQCDKEFHTNIGLLRHQSNAHGAKQFPCDKPGCSKVFKNESALSDHNKRVHGPRSFACVHCNAYFTTETYLKAHVKIHMEKKHVCKQCSHSFVNKTDLNNHMRVHTGVKPYGCKVCGKAFRHVSGYYTHVRIHTGETPYQCEFCDKKFTNASNFQTHRKIHTQDKKFKCEMCGKEFIQQSNFTRHKRTHTKERPYKCEQCGEEFSYSTCLKKHLKKDHDVKPIECDRCKRTFLNKSSYVRHRTGCQFKDIVKREAETDSAQFL